MPIIVFITLALLHFSAGQNDVAQCGLTCIANVTNTGCSASQWTCLCTKDTYLANVNTCAQQSCNKTDYDTTISAVAELCAIFNIVPSISPYATASTGTGNPVVSTLAITSMTGASSTPSQTVSDIMTPSLSITTVTGTGSVTASASTTNVAQKIDLGRGILQGIAVALLGFAVYL